METDLAKWMENRLLADRNRGLPRQWGSPEVTAVAYVFGEPDRLPGYVKSAELALRETYRHCGRLKTTLVVNAATAEAERLAEEFGEGFRIDVDPSLRPGDIAGFSRNMIRTLPSRFDTPYLLNIHPDGFPLRPGLEKFIGRWDYVGGPWRIDHDDWITRLLLNRSDGAGNGGFALRSRKICEMAAAAYRRFWKIIPDCYLLYEDVFFTRLLPRWQPGYARRLRIADRNGAAEFSFCENLAAQEQYGKLPFGFHSWRSFRKLQCNGLLKLDDSNIMAEN